MPDVIHLLPDVLANQIAAGEVVQRPASVVKEMLENAVDAGADRIRLIVEKAGRTLIQVVDNGSGMSATDARMCFERHATSKIQTSDDLFAIQTFGFRGEAMASIAAVAQVELKTRREADELGTRLYIEGNELKDEEPIQHNPGTSIAVRNLFFNTPARRKFLKSDAVEFRHIVEEFQRVALARPNIAMALVHNGEELYQLPSGKLAKRIISLFGKNYQKHLIACEEKVTHVQIRGYIGRPDIAKKTRGEQFLFVNKRFVKHGYLHHAIMNAYQGLLAEGQQPFYTLFLEMDTKMVDINVHPMKTEVKFEDERTLYGLVQAAVRQALGVNQVSAPIDFDLNANFGKANPRGTALSTSGSGHRKPDPGRREKQNLRHWERLYQTGSASEDPGFMQQFLNTASPEDEQTTMTFSSAANDTEESVAPETTPTPDLSSDTGKTWVFQVGKRFIASPVRSGILLVNQQAAHERILYERFLRNLESGKGLSQQLLFPATLSLNAADFALLESLDTELRAMGFVFEKTDGHKIKLSGIPSDLPEISEVALLEELLEQYKQQQKNLKATQYPALAQVLARRAAIKEGQPLQVEEMKKLIDLLFGCQNPNYSPDGERTYTFADAEMIANLF